MYTAKIVMSKQKWKGKRMTKNAKKECSQVITLFGNVVTKGQLY
jgi:hypothetical protein